MPKANPFFENPTRNRTMKIITVNPELMRVVVKKPFAMKRSKERRRTPRSKTGNTLLLASFLKRKT